MSIGADCNDFSPQFSITANHIGAGIGNAQTVGEAAGIDFQADSVGNQGTDNLIQNITVFCIRIGCVFVRAVAHDIVDVTVCINVIKDIQILDNRFKIFTVAGLFIVVLEKNRILRVIAVHGVGRTDDKVKCFLT